MICKSCGAIFFEYRKNSLCLNCFNQYKIVLEPLEMSHKAWNKFDWNQQEALTSCYAVTIPDYQTRREKTIGFLKKFNKTNLNKGIDTMQNGIESFSNAMDKMKMDESQNKKILKAFASNENKDISIITGKRKSII